MIKGVKRVLRSVGPQITGCLVDLAETDPEMAKLYVESVQYYWRSKAGEKGMEETKSVTAKKLEKRLKSSLFYYF